MKKNYFLLVYFLIPILSFAQTTQSYKAPFFKDNNRLEKIKPFFPIIEKIYREHAEKNHFPGYSFGVVMDGSLVFSGTGGYTDVVSKNQVNNQTMFRIASMSKSFTAMAILKLRDEGKLRLDDAVENYIPELRNQQLTKDAPTITIRDLMTHSAGFPQDDPWADRQLADTEEELLDVIKKGLHFSNVPGLRYEYSNLGFTMLGYIIHKVSGKPYSTYIKENIWQPLGMSQAEWEFNKVPAFQLAKGHRWINNQWIDEPLLNDGIYGSMGGMITSMESFSKYIAFHLNAWPPSNTDDIGPVKRSTVREMHQPWRYSGLNAQYRYPNGRICATASAYTYGLRWTNDCEGRTAVGHSGGLPGFGSNWLILPEYGIGVAFFANVTYAPTADPNIQVLDTLVRAAQLEPRVLPPSDVLLKAQKELLFLLPDWKNAANSSLFAENFFLDKPIQDLIKECRDIFNAAGNIIHVDDIVPLNQLRGQVTLRCENGDIQIFFTLTPTNPAQIQDFRIRRVQRGR